MSKPANKTLIGIFVLGAMALVVVAIVVLGSGKLFKKTFLAVCYFRGFRRWIEYRCSCCISRGQGGYGRQCQVTLRSESGTDSNSGVCRA